MLVDALLQNEVEGRVDRLVKEVEELESKRAELVDELVIKVAEEVVDVTERMEVLAKSLTLLQSSLRSYKIYFQLSSPKNDNLGNGRNGCSYKDFVACNPKEFDDKGGAVAYIRWVEKMEVVHDISGCGDHQKTRGSAAIVGMTWENFKALMREEYYQSNEMQRLVPHLVTPETKRIKRYIYGIAPQIRGMLAATEPSTIQNAILKAMVLTDEAVRNGSLKINGGETSKEGNVKSDNKRARTGKVFATITNPVKK
ncbi:hypothetical protein Tco_1464129 [Tanacetum coccineum]